MPLIRSVRRQFTMGPPVVNYIGQAQVISFVGAREVLWRGTVLGGNPGVLDENKLIVGIAGQQGGQFPVAASINGRIAPVYGTTLTAAGIGLFAALVPDIGNLTIDVRWNADVAGTPNLNLWSIFGLSSPIPRSVVASSLAGADTVRSVDVNSEVGGVAVAMSVCDVAAAQSVTWSGDQTPTKNVDTNGGGSQFSAALIQGTNADAANTITATLAVISIAAIGLIAASFR